ncbi:MAG: IS1634 family transposase [Candidatus Thermoplasmatota archaeon]|nr:IS1634 family transposase [Candidatus Thermoplasmatota archaeon]
MHFKIKTIKNKKYLYIVKNQRINGKMKRVIEKYIGNADTIYELTNGADNHKVTSFQFGRIAALLHASEKLEFIESIDKIIKRRNQKGLTVGQYLLLMIMGRSEGAYSRNKMEDWYQHSGMSFIWTERNKLSAQNCLNYMKRLTDEKIKRIEEEIAKRLYEQGYSPSKLIFDTSNFYTNIVKGEKLPRKGNSKHKRYDKNIVGVGLVVNDDNIPFMSEAYEGNRHESELFVEMFETISKRIESLKVDAKEITMVFDRGVNSEENVKEVMKRMHLVGSLNWEQAKKYFEESLDKYEKIKGKGSKSACKVKRYDGENLYGNECTVVVRYNEKTEKRQRETYEKYRSKIEVVVKELKEKGNREGKGRKLGEKGAINKLTDVIPQQYRGIYEYGVVTEDKKVKVKCEVIKKREEELYKSFGKQAIFTDNQELETGEIANIYNRKEKIEEDFKWLNNKLLIPMKPFYVWKDLTIRAHVFLCMMGLLLYRYIASEIGEKNISVERLAEILDRIKIAVVKEEGNKAEMVVEEMEKESANANIFSRLRLDRYVPW